MYFTIFILAMIILALTVQLYKALGDKNHLNTLLKTQTLIIDRKNKILNNKEELLITITNNNLDLHRKLRDNQSLNHEHNIGIDLRKPDSKPNTYEVTKDEEGKPLIHLQLPTGKTAESRTGGSFEDIGDVWKQSGGNY